MSRDVVVATGLTPAQAELAQANTGLIGWTLKRYPHLVGGLYTADDAFQDGFIGLCRAVQTFDPTRAQLSTVAVPRIRVYVVRGRGAFEGKDYRRAWLDGTVDLLPGRGALDEALVADVDVEASALAGASLDSVLERASALCHDDLDRAALAALMDGTPAAVVARAHGVTRMTAGRRQATLVARLRSAA